MFWRGKQMYRRLSEDVCAAGVSVGDPRPEPVSEQDCAGLPETVQRYLNAMGVVGRPRDWSFQAHLTGACKRPGDRTPDR